MIERNIFEKLVKKIINKTEYNELMYKKHTYKDYKRFLKFAEKISNIKEINEENFENFFISFCMQTHNKNRINFSKNTRKEIAENSAYCCAMIHCRRYTKEYDTKDIKKESGFGQAAHIISASKNNKTRQQVLTDKEYVSSSKNGIWLCSNCHPYADYVPAADLYKVNTLIGYKEQVENQVKNFLLRKNKKYENLSYKEINELNKLIYSTKVEIIFNKLTKEEAIMHLEMNAINEIYLTLNKYERKKYLNLEEIEISKNNIDFYPVNNEIKNNMKDLVKIQNFQRIDFLLTFENKYKSYNIDNCQLTRSGDVATAQGYFFDKNHPLYKILIFSISSNQKENKISVSIKINYNELLNGSYELKEMGDFNEILDLIDNIENNKINFGIRYSKEEKYKFDNYQYLNIELNEFKNIFMFLKIIQYISINMNLRIFITKNMIDKNSCIFRYLNVLHDSIIFNNPPQNINLKNIFYYYDFDYFYNNCLNINNKYIKPKNIVFGFQIPLDYHQIDINLGNYYGFDSMLIRKKDTDIVIDVYDKTFIFNGC